jgi:type I restriction enzyme M protein
VNATQDFTKGEPKNYLSEEAIERIAAVFREPRDVPRLSRVVSREEIEANDFNLLPTRYVQTHVLEEYRPIAEITADIEKLEAEVQEATKTLSALFGRRDG